MKALFLTRWRPHAPESGAARRNAQNIAAVSGIGEVDVFSIGRREEATTAHGVRAWHHFEAAAWRDGALGMLLEADYHPLTDAARHPEAERLLVSLLAEEAYDVAVVEELALASHIPSIGAAGVPVVFDAHNVEARLRADLARAAPASPRERLKRRVLDARLTAIERRAVGSAALVLACSDADANHLVRLDRPSAPVVTVPNAVDTRGRRRGAPPAAGDPLRIVCTASFGYRPNVAAALELARDVLPALAAAGAPARLALVGREPPPELLGIAARDPAVEVTGAVPSVERWLTGGAMMALPIRSGSGMRRKILEAFAAGCPVVTTAKGLEGINAKDGVHVRLADTVAEFRDAILALHRDPAAWRAQTAAAFDLVERRYSWEAAAVILRRALDAHLGLPARARSAA